MTLFSGRIQLQVQQYNGRTAAESTILRQDCWQTIHTKNKRNVRRDENKGQVLVRTNPSKKVRTRKGP